MADKVSAGPIQDVTCAREAVCIHTKKILDSCRDKDCIEDLRVFFTRESQEIVDRAASIKARTAELLYVYIDVEAIPFNRGFYTVDVQYFYKITADVYVGGIRPLTVVGLATFNKRVLLFGSEGSAKIFDSKSSLCHLDAHSVANANLPKAVVEAVDPIVLDIRLAEVCDCDCGGECSCEIPTCVCEFFEDELIMNGEAKRVFVTLGQFSIIRLERDVQLLIPSFDYCIPNKDCSAVGGASTDDPCEMFRQISFPLEDFFPPSASDLGETVTNGCCCE